ncbi:tripartite tricarboxylate transporter substrate binding protein [Tardiphaga sp.]|uniref:Bug family tripartite tricarboxylate transporter substrate binding protein n=1 Tax=Tardiphaga sp. TaxID=1926292 RepID=UPI002621DADB|nr:tripartite tricarboxylate transporter substrate binding protein [Tardiphaga sp.]MDB5618366.1 tripartite tricarboxylate transporter substrate binding protein [Tardiphaga sp.]
MNISRRAVMAAGLGLLATPKLARAQTFPVRPLKMVVPFAAGGPTDFIIRLLVDPLAGNLGQSVVVENRAGAAGNLGAVAVAQGDADGYTMLHSTVAMLAVNPILYPAPSFNPMRDFNTIATTASLPNVLVVNPKVTDVSSVADLITFAKSKPGGLTYATFGAGSSPHILGAMFQKLTGIEAVPVPYRGSAPALTDVIGGRVDMLFDSITTSTEQINAGTVRALAVTSAERVSQQPNVPTMKEAGFAGFDLTFWFSVQVPAATPEATVARLQSALYDTMAQQSFADALQLRGAERLVVPRAELKDYVARESERWTRVANEIGLKPL